VLAVALALVVVATGCAAVRGLLDTERALRRAGFERVDISVDSRGPDDTVQVTARQARAHEDPNGAVAGVVWREFPFRFDRLDVFVTSVPARSYSREELVGRFGPRPAHLDQRSLEDSIRRTGLVVAVAVAVAFFGFLAIVIVTVVLVVRSQRKRRAPLQTGPWMPPPGMGGAPPPPSPG
jgi:hypothetical protein